jgi:hypothetical protein
MSIRKFLTRSNFEFFESTEDFLVKSKKFDCEQYTTNLRDVTITEDYKFKNGIGPMKMTEEAFTTLMKIFKIPLNFAEGIPNDLLQKNISRLQNLDNNRNIQLNCLINNNFEEPFIVEFNDNPDKKHINFSNFYQFYSSNDKKLIKGMLSNSSLLFQFCDSQDFNIGDNDIYNLGKALQYSYNNHPTIIPFILRLICTNGAMDHTYFGNQTVRFKNEFSDEQIQDAIINKFNIFLVVYLFFGIYQNRCLAHYCVFLRHDNFRDLQSADHSLRGFDHIRRFFVNQSRLYL